MKISFQTDVGTTIIKETDFSVEDCPKYGGHCWVEYQSMDVTGFSQKERTCKHCGLKQTLHIIPEKKEWK